MLCSEPTGQGDQRCERQREEWVGQRDDACDEQRADGEQRSLTDCVQRVRPLPGVLAGGNF